ncbi:MAG: hypothetical protein Fues2KO_40480 [Fuerstiella sp.]
MRIEVQAGRKLASCGRNNFVGRTERSELRQDGASAAELNGPRLPELTSFGPAYGAAAYDDANDGLDYGWPSVRYFVTWQLRQPP